MIISQLSWVNGKTIKTNNTTYETATPDRWVQAHDLSGLSQLQMPVDDHKSNTWLNIVTYEHVKQERITE